MKKKIGISFSKTNFKYYWEWFTPEDLQDDVELVNLSFVENNASDIYKCDGFVLTGGVDIDPSFYGGLNEYNYKPEFQIERDRFEEKIFKHAKTSRLPLLGICRGLQLVNVLQGGNLVQDLDEQNEIHKKEDETDKEHDIRIEGSSLLHEITGLDFGKVNSAHHQAVMPHIIGDDLTINAISASGEKTIEGLEYKDKSDKGFMLCVQWHPERMTDREQNPFSKKIKSRFIEEIKNQ
jgi:putative glutamine amidotransferase